MGELEKSQKKQTEKERQKQDNKYRRTRESRIKEENDKTERDKKLRGGDTKKRGRYVPIRALYLSFAFESVAVCYRGSVAVRLRICCIASNR